MNNSLQHHGVLGMKWGVRRYQNRDGTLTDAGRRRLGQISDNSRRVSYDEISGRIGDGSENQRRARSGIHQNVANDYNQASNIAKSAGNISKTAANITRQAEANRRRKEVEKIDVSKMSDQELRELINRMNLERSYKSLSAENISSGKEYVSDILSTAGDVLAAGASVASIMAAIHLIKS